MRKYSEIRNNPLQINPKIFRSFLFCLHFSFSKEKSKTVSPQIFKKHLQTGRKSVIILR